MSDKIHNSQFIILNSSESGFVVLISTMILSAILLAMVFSVSFSGFFTRFNLLDSENKERSLSLAEACANLAILKRFEDSSYLGNETLVIGSEKCKVRLIMVPSDIIIETTASKSGSFSNIRVNLNPVTFSITRWREVGSF